MDDRMKESISALLDNEADELELRRVLNHENGEAVKAVWSRYSQVSDLLSSGQHVYERELHVSHQEDIQIESNEHFLDIDISAQITQSIDAIDSVEEQEVSGDEGSAHSSETSVASLPTKKGIRFLPALAVAATVIMAVSLAFLPLDRNVDSGAERLVASISGHVPVVNRTLSEKHARTLNQYLLRHAENSVAGGRSGLMPLTRVANFSIAQN